jgi:hypothetical protein
VERLGAVATVAVAATVGLRLAVSAKRSPIMANDEWAIWVLRGRVMALTGHLDPRFFLNANAHYQHLDYPLLVPSLVAWSDGFARRPLDGGVHLQITLLVLALLLVVGWAVGRLAGPLAAVTAVVAVAALPRALSYLGRLAVADVPLVTFALSAILLLALWVREPHRDLLVIAGVLAVGAVSTKNEGLLFVLAAFAGAATAMVRRRHLLLQLAATLGAAIIEVLPWTLYTRAHHLENSFLNPRTLAPGHIAKTLPWAGAVLREMIRGFPGNPYGLPGAPTYSHAAKLALGAALLAACAFGLRRERRVLLVQLTVTQALLLAGLFAQYLVDVPVDRPPDQVLVGIVGHMRSTTFRVLLLPAVLLLLVPLLLTGRARGGGAAQPADGPTGGQVSDTTYAGATHTGCG